MKEVTEKKLPKRDEVDRQDRWDLSALFDSDEAWKKSLKLFEKEREAIGKFQGKLNTKESIKEGLDLLLSLALQDESLGYYVFLRKDEDIESREANELYEEYSRSAVEYSELCSFFFSEILQNTQEFLDSLLESKEFSEYRIFLEKEIRYKPHTLKSSEERLLAGMGEFTDLPSRGFSVLTNVDMDFGQIEKGGEKSPLTQSSYASFLRDQEREIRKKAYFQFLKEFDKHKNTLATLYAGSIKKDGYFTKIRNFKSSRERALFGDKVDVKVYDTLIEIVHKNLPLLHRYYDLRKRVLQLEELTLYDLAVPLVKNEPINLPYDQGVDLLEKAFSPLGEEYVSTVTEGLRGRWVDRYENKGKRSGAYSAGSYRGDPYILMNYRSDDIDSLFTLAHEAGHSMHSWYSKRNNPFQHYNYTIFEAEVASTFNEQLLADYLLGRDDFLVPKAYLYTSLIEDIIGTVFRQTMFAEFEKKLYHSSEKGTPLTLDFFRQTYRELCELYYGEGVVLDEYCDLVGLRIPHFYRAFYVYKYATGLSAAVTLSEGVLHSGTTNREKYLLFLKSGGSHYPLDSLRRAGVDLECGKPVENTMIKFGNLLDKLEKTLG